MLKIFFPKENNRIQISSDARGLDNFFVNFFSIFFLKKVMAMFEVDFIFCCPCFVLAFPIWDFKNFVEFFHFIYRRNRREACDIVNFPSKKNMLVSCFLHLSAAMDLDSLECLHCNTCVFYRVVLDDGPYAIRKSYSC